MNNIIKGEWIRFRKSYNFPFYTIIICIFLTIFPFISLVGYGKINVSTYLTSNINFSPMYVPLLLSIIISISISLNYTTKTAYYEIMSGKSANSIIISRIIFYSVFMAGCYIICMGFGMTVVSIICGEGELDYIVVRMLLYIIILIHICTISVLISVALHSFLSLILVPIRLGTVGMITSTMLPLVLFGCPSWSGTKYQGVGNYFISSQIISVFTNKVNTTLVLPIILSFLFETLLWYLVASVSLKQKRF